MKKPPWGKLPPPGERLPRPVDNREHREGRQTFRSGGSTSSEEEPESSVSTTSDEEDPLRGSPGGVSCAAESCAAATVANGRTLCLTKLAQDAMWRRMRLRRGTLCDSPPESGHTAHGVRLLLPHDTPDLRDMDSAVFVSMSSWG